MSKFSKYQVRTILVPLITNKDGQFCYFSSNVMRVTKNVMALCNLTDCLYNTRLAYSPILQVAYHSRHA